MDKRPAINPTVDDSAQARFPGPPKLVRPAVGYGDPADTLGVNDLRGSGDGRTPLANLAERLGGGATPGSTNRP